MIVITCSINIEIQPVINKDRFLLINTEKKMKYPHLYINTSISKEETLKHVFTYLDKNYMNTVDKKITIYAQETEIEDFFYNNFLEEDKAQKKWSFDDQQATQTDNDNDISFLNKINELLMEDKVVEDFFK